MMAEIVWLCFLISLVPVAECHQDRPPCRTIRMDRRFPCDVTECGSNVTFDCSWRQLKNFSDVSDVIFPNTTKLNLSNNAILVIYKDAFSKLSNLSVLDLRWAAGKKELAIHRNVFRDLKNLKELRLAGISESSTPKQLPPSLNILQLSNSKMVTLNWLAKVSGKENITELLLFKNCYWDNQCHVSFKIADNTFETMTKLQSLELSFNNLTEVPKGLPKSLEKLNLESNAIRSVEKDAFSGLHHLTHLLIQGNCPRCENAPYHCVSCPSSLNIDSQAFTNLTALRMLNLGGNSLHKLESSWFKNMPNLESLLLPFNFLRKAITTEGGEADWLNYLPKLNILDLSFNYHFKVYSDTLKLSENFSNLTSLKILHLEAVVFKRITKETLEPLLKLRNLSALNLGTNFVIEITANNFPQLKFLFLGENRLYPMVNQTHHKYFSRMPQTAPRSPLTRRIPDYKVHRHVKQECYDAGNVLVLSRNNIFFIDDTQFKGYQSISCLNLSHNGFSVALNGTEFSLLPNLTYLDLSFNKIDLAYGRAFIELPKLEILDISYNAHYFEAIGITINLNFTLNLPFLRVLNMSFNRISSLTTKEMFSKSLSELRFTDNNLGDLWDDGEYHNLFTHLTNLSILDISSNGIERIPRQFYQNLPQNVTQLYIAHNRLETFGWDQLQNFTKLHTLDLSNNSMSELTYTSAYPPSLEVLDLSFNRILQLGDGIFKGGHSLKTIYLNHNELTIINQSTFASDPENEIDTLYIHNNPFLCTCDFLDFILWMDQSNVKIPQLTTDVKCDSPRILKGHLLIKFDIQECVNDSVSKIVCIVTGTFIFAFIALTMTAHLFYWDVFYIVHLIKAKVKGFHSLHSPGSVYDVFVTYDTKDPCVSEWVMEKLLVELEEEGDTQHPLCLEERDWCVGTPILENLTHSIRNSRKTLFVLTEDYVKTGMFKLAMYLAHQRLLDENVDVILVLLLEPVMQSSHFLRLRRRLCGQSVLEWPRTAAAESWFWQNLRNIIKVDNEVLYNKTYIHYFTSR